MAGFVPGGLIIPGPSPVSAGADRLRRVFCGPIKLGPGLGPAIVAFDLWIGAIVAAEVPPLEHASPRADIADFISSVAGTVAGDAQGKEKHLLRKAVEETLFVAAGQNIQISPRVAQKRWVRYNKAHGQSAMIEMFLANHLWNVLWLKAGDVFGQSDREALEYTMRRLKRTCQLFVNAVCQSKGLKDSLNLPVAEQVIRALEANILPS